MTLRLLRGDMRETLATLEPGSVQACITSPPYWGLRSYGTPDLTWADGWVGSLGLEPTPELFVEHIVECFRAVKRVLRDDGVVFCNLGDSYSGSGKGPTGWNGIGEQDRRQGFRGGADTRARRSERPREGDQYKPKDLLEIPSMVAQALRADGWYLRSRIPWLKRNAMPESVTDRPASSVEYVFLLSKSARYYWDADAIRMPNADPARTNYKPGPSAYSEGNVHDATGRSRRNDGFQKYAEGASMNGRNRRNGDWFFESWQGLLLDEDDAPLALVVNPAPLKIAHYASFPPKLVEPMVKASTSEKGCCPECGAPWVREVERGESAYARLKREHGMDWTDMEATAAAQGKNMKSGGKSVGGTRKPNGVMAQLNAGPSATVGWRPSCGHSAARGTVPCTVLDPFAGSGTTLMVSDRLGRNAIGCELSEAYSDMGADRIVGDSPMFVELGA